MNAKRPTFREKLGSVNYDADILCNSWSGNDFNDIKSVEPDHMYSIFSEISRNINEVLVEIDQELFNLQIAASTLDQNQLGLKLNSHSENLREIYIDVCKVSNSYSETSADAIMVGNRLAISEAERKRIQCAEELLSYIKLLQNSLPTQFKTLENFEGNILKSKLPFDLPNKSWGEISKVIYNLNLILGDINCDDALIAQRNVQLLSDIIENELLLQFETSVNALISDIENHQSILDCQELAASLFLFNNGAHVQRRFVFGIVQSRINSTNNASSADSMLLRSSSTSPSSRINKLRSSRLGLSKRNLDDKGGSPGSSGGGGSQKTQRNSITGGIDLNDNTLTEGSGLQLLDHLSNLFNGITNLCLEQSHIIRLIFPRQAGEKITKQLLLRIFNDPAFGLQTKIDAVLRPRPPAPPLSLSDYLNALSVVREKLSALESMLLDCCGDSLLIIPEDITDEERKIAIKTNEEINSAKELLRGFLEEQVSQLIYPYQDGYFQNEINLLRVIFTDALREATKDRDTTLFQKSSGAGLPKLRHDRVRTVTQLCRPGGVASKGFISVILSAAEESVSRMMAVAKGDKKTPQRAKDVFLVTQTFLLECTLTPAARACTIMLIKIASTPCNSSALQQSPTPKEFITGLGAIYDGISRLKQTFEKVFMAAISTVPNILIAMKEQRRKSIAGLVSVFKDTVKAWLWTHVVRIEYILQSMQLKTDYRPKSHTSSDRMEMSRDATSACRQVAELIRQLLAEAARELPQADLATMVWRPFGELFVAALISHIRRQRISPDGALQLVLDIEEYRKALEGPPTPCKPCVEPQLLLRSIREITYIFMVPAQDVVRVVSEELRHLDAAVLMAFLSAREDFAGKSGTGWARQLSASFPSTSMTGALPWEFKLPANALPVGPSSLLQGRLLSLDPRSSVVRSSQRIAADSYLELGAAGSDSLSSQTLLTGAAGILELTLDDELEEDDDEEEDDDQESYGDYNDSFSGSEVDISEPRSDDNDSEEEDFTLARGALNENQTEDDFSPIDNPRRKNKRSLKKNQKIVGTTTGTQVDFQQQASGGGGGGGMISTMTSMFKQRK